MMTNVLLFIVFIILSLYFVESNQKCPSKCICYNSIVKCQGPIRAISQIPISIPKITTELIIMDQSFYNSTLSYGNFSSYGFEFVTNFRKLAIKNCGITSIAPKTFDHLFNLKYLDLSNNKLKLILSRTLRTLTLEKLNLDNNPFLVIDKSSFEGLSVVHLSMINCNLRNLTYPSIKEIIGSLKKLDISNNKITTFEKQFSTVFMKLTELYMNDNEFKCNCRLKWLYDIYKKKHNSGTYTLNFPSIMCASPFNLRGKILDKLLRNQLTCNKPMIEKISIDIFSVNSAILVCKSLINSDNIVKWYSYANTYDRKLILLNRSPIESMINISRSSYTNTQYRCEVVNDNGKVGLDVKINWPKSQFSKYSMTTKASLITSSNIIKYNRNKNYNEESMGSKRYLFIKQFTLFELLLSIASTFIITIVLFATLYLIFAKKCISKGYFNGNQYMTKFPPTYLPHHYTSSKYSQNHNNQNSNNNCTNLTKAPLSINGTSSNELYSGGDSLIYDLPQHLPSPAINNRINNNDNLNLSTPNLLSDIATPPTTHLIDFKTQKRLPHHHNHQPHHYNTTTHYHQHPQSHIMQ